MAIIRQSRLNIVLIGKSTLPNNLPSNAKSAEYNLLLFDGWKIGKYSQVSLLVSV